MEKKSISLHSISFSVDEWKDLYWTLWHHLNCLDDYLKLDDQDTGEPEIYKKEKTSAGRMMVRIKNSIIDAGEKWED